jgi:hypothetical protein
MERMMKKYKIDNVWMKCEKCGEIWFDEFKDWGSEIQYICKTCGTLTPIDMRQTKIEVRKLREMTIRYNDRVEENGINNRIINKFDYIDFEDKTGSCYYMYHKDNYIGFVTKISIFNLLQNYIPNLRYEQDEISLDVKTSKSNLLVRFIDNKIESITQGFKEFFGDNYTTLYTDMCKKCSESNISSYNINDNTYMILYLNKVFSVSQYGELLYKSNDLKDIRDMYFEGTGMKRLKNQVKYNDFSSNDFYVELGYEFTYPERKVFETTLKGDCE